MQSFRVSSIDFPRPSDRHRRSLKRKTIKSLDDYFIKSDSLRLRFDVKVLQFHHIIIEAVLCTNGSFSLLL